MSRTDFEEETYSTIFSSLKHPIRRRILRMLDNNPSTYSDILEELRIDSGHMNYHLDQLGILLTKCDTSYGLSAFGKIAVGLMKGIEEPLPKIGQRSNRGVPKKVLAGLLMLILVSSTLGLTSIHYHGQNNQLRLQLTQYFTSLVELQEDFDDLNTTNEAIKKRNEELDDALESRREEVKLYQTELEVLNRHIGGLRNWISSNQGVLELSAVNMITSEPGRLSVWGYDELHDAYVDIWIAENVYYDSVAIGDIGSDGLREIIGTASIDMKGTIIHNATCCWVGTPYLSYFPPYDIFFEVYKEGQSGISATSEAVKDTAHDRNEIIIADVDPVQLGNEVVMKTRHWLVVYNSEYKIVGKTNWFAEGVQVTFEGVAVANMDDDSQNEIIVSGNVEGLENSGHIFIFDLVVDPKLESPTILHLDRPVGGVLTGDLDGDGFSELLTTSNRVQDYDYHCYAIILDWRHGSWQILDEHQIAEAAKWHMEWPAVQYDIGNIDRRDTNEEIVFGTSIPKPELSGEYVVQLILYRLIDDVLTEMHSWTMEDYKYINNVLVTDSDLDGTKEAVVGGTYYPVVFEGAWYLYMYIEVFDFHKTAISEWHIFDSEREYAPQDIAVG